MKTRNLHIVCLLLAALSLTFGVRAEKKGDCLNPETCEQLRECLNMPSYYCECHDAVRFYYGIDTVINGDQWFRASVKDLVNGTMAYWQSDDSARIDVYAFCASTEPTLTKYIGPHSSVYITPHDVGILMESIPSGLFDNMDAFMHFSSVHGGQGRAICFSGKEGAVSTCDDPLEFNPYCNYAFLNTQVFELRFRQKPTQVYLRYRNEIDMSDSVSLKVHYGTCDGPVVAEHVFVDSMRPYFMPLDIALKAWDDSTSLFMEMTNSSSENVAHIYYRSWVRFVPQTIDTAICRGMGLQLLDTLLTEPTTFVDTICSRKFKGDTIFINTYNITISDADTVLRSLKLKGSQFPYYYLGEVIRGYGRYVFERKVEGECSQVIDLTVSPQYTIKRETKDSTLCQGMIFEINGKTRTTNGNVMDTTYSGVYLDQQLITTYRLKFLSPVLEYDTIALHQEVLPYKYYGNTISQFGEKTITITQKGECTRRVKLMVLESDGSLVFYRQEKDTVGCATYGLQFPDSLIMEPTTYVDTVLLTDTTMLITTWHIRMDQPGQVVNDTIALEQSDFPYMTEEMRITGYGVYELYRSSGACDQLVHLAVVPRFIDMEIDTTLCTGAVLDLGDTLITTLTRYTQIVPQNAYTSLKIVWKVRFKDQEPVSETLEIPSTDLPYEYGDRTITHAGTYLVRLTEEGECDKLIDLTVVLTDAAVGKLDGDEWMVVPTMVQAGQTIELRGNASGHMQVVDMLGKTVIDRPIEPGISAFTINQTGVWMVLVSNEKTTKVYKLVVK